MVCHQITLDDFMPVFLNGLLDMADGGAWKFICMYPLYANEFQYGLQQLLHCMRLFLHALAMAMQQTGGKQLAPDTMS